MLIFSGILRVGQEIEVRPGIVSKSADGRVQCRPIYSKIVSLFAEQNQLQYAVPGGEFICTFDFFSSSFFLFLLLAVVVFRFYSQKLRVSLMICHGTVEFQRRYYRNKL